MERLESRVFEIIPIVAILEYRQTALSKTRAGRAAFVGWSWAQILEKHAIHKRIAK